MAHTLKDANNLDEHAVKTHIKNTGNKMDSKGYASRYPKKSTLTTSGDSALGEDPSHSSASSECSLLMSSMSGSLEQPIHPGTETNDVSERENRNATTLDSSQATGIKTPEQVTQSSAKQLFQRTTQQLIAKIAAAAAAAAHAAATRHVASTQLQPETQAEVARCSNENSNESGLTVETAQNAAEMDSEALDSQPRVTQVVPSSTWPYKKRFLPSKENHNKHQKLLDGVACNTSLDSRESSMDDEDSEHLETDGNSRRRSSSAELHEDATDPMACRTPSPTPEQSLDEKDLPEVPRYSPSKAGGLNKQRACLHCGSVKTPLWRNGIYGPKTLCNACGIRHKLGKLTEQYYPYAPRETWADPEFSGAHLSNFTRKKMSKQSMKVRPQQRERIKEEVQEEQNCDQHTEHRSKRVRVVTERAKAHLLNSSATRAPKFTNLAATPALTQQEGALVLLTLATNPVPAPYQA